MEHTTVLAANCSGQKLSQYQFPLQTAALIALLCSLTKTSDGFTVTFLLNKLVLPV